MIGIAARELKSRRAGAPSLLGALSVVFASIFGQAVAEAQTRDLWQTYMDAAQASDASENFTAEAIILNAALGFANQHDRDGQRPVLTRLPLLLAYGELDRKDLMKPLAAQGLHIDVANLDDRFSDYIGTTYAYANSYMSRWDAHANDSASDALAFAQAIRFYGTKNSFSIEISFRTKLRPDDKIGLARAMSLLGLSYKKNGYLNCAGYDYAGASQTFQDFRQTLDAMETAGNLFDVGGQTTWGVGQRTLDPAEFDTQVALLTAFQAYMMTVAYETLHPDTEELSTAKTDWDFCSRWGPPLKTSPAVGFDAQISRALEYHNVQLSLTQQLAKYWPNNMFFGEIDSQTAELYKLEYESSLLKPGTYADSLAKARSAYEGALKILTYAAGSGAPTLGIIASHYAGLLVEAKLPAEAEKIESQYGVKPSN